MLILILMLMISGVDHAFSAIKLPDEEDSNGLSHGACAINLPDRTDLHHLVLPDGKVAPLFI